LGGVEMRFYLIAGLLNGGILVGSFLWLFLDGYHLLPVVALMLSSMSFGLLLGEANE